MFTREPSGRRRSAMGDAVFTRRLTRAAMTSVSELMEMATTFRIGYSRKISSSAMKMILQTLKTFSPRERLIKS